MQNILNITAMYHRVKSKFSWARSVKKNRVLIIPPPITRGQSFAIPSCDWLRTLSGYWKIAKIGRLDVLDVQTVWIRTGAWNLIWLLKIKDTNNMITIFFKRHKFIVFVCLKLKQSKLYAFKNVDYVIFINYINI